MFTFHHAIFLLPLSRCWWLQLAAVLPAPSWRSDKRWLLYILWRRCYTLGTNAGYFGIDVVLFVRRWSLTFLDALVCVAFVRGWEVGELLGESRVLLGRCSIFLFYVYRDCLAAVLVELTHSIEIRLLLFDQMLLRRLSLMKWSRPVIVLLLACAPWSRSRPWFASLQSCAILLLPYVEFWDLLYFLVLLPWYLPCFRPLTWIQHSILSVLLRSIWHSFWCPDLPSGARTIPCLCFET